MILLPANKNFYLGATYIFLFYAALEIVNVAAVTVNAMLGLPVVIPAIIYLSLCLIFLLITITVKDKLPAINPAVVITVIALWLVYILIGDMSYSLQHKFMVERYGESMDTYGRLVGVSNVIRTFGRALISTGIVVVLIRYMGLRKRIRKGSPLTQGESTLGYAFWGTLSFCLLYNCQNIILRISNILYYNTGVNVAVPLIFVALFCAFTLVLAAVMAGKNLPRINPALFVTTLVISGLLYLVFTYLPLIRSYTLDRLETAAFAIKATYIVSQLWLTAIGIIAYYQYTVQFKKEKRQ